MKVIVCGGRDYTPTKEDEQKLLTVLKWLRPDEVVHGACSGVDQWAGEIAKAAGFETAEFPADWLKHGRKGGPLRNSQMAFYVKSHGGGVCLAFPGGAGTRNMIEQARDYGIVVFPPEES